MNVDARLGHAWMWLALIAGVLAIYLPDVGHGFIQDDFAWILHARSHSVVDALDRAFTTSLGFFRPLVTLSFTLNAWTSDLEPFGYGLTNLLLVVLCMFGVERLGRRLGLAPGYALLAAAVWVLNVHGINMGVLWISARSSLFSTLFGVLAACMFESRRRLLTIACVSLALLSKEDAVLLPFILTAWRLVDQVSGGSKPPQRGRRAGDPGKDPPLLVRGSTRGSPYVGRGGSLDPPAVVRDCWPLFALLAVYAVLRHQSGAFTPLTAPDFYRFTMDPERLMRNLVEYLSRSVATGAIVLIGVLVIARVKPRLDRIHTAITRKGIIWWLGGFALTMWLPVRSSLYAVFPSVGIAIIVAALAASVVPALPAARRRTLVIVGVLLPFLLLPLYRARNVRWVSLADLSTATLRHARAKLPQLPDRAVIALIDDRDVRANFINAFSSLTPEASQLFLDRGVELIIDPPDDPSRARVSIRLADVVR